MCQYFPRDTPVPKWRDVCPPAPQPSFPWAGLGWTQRSQTQSSRCPWPHRHVTRMCTCIPWENTKTSLKTCLLCPRSLSRHCQSPVCQCLKPCSRKAGGGVCVSVCLCVPARAMVLAAPSVPFPAGRAAPRVPVLQPRSCCFPLFSSRPNRRGQVRCASKHCNHILNGNEMCELNVNYSRMEGQSLLVKV